MSRFSLKQDDHIFCTQSKKVGALSSCSLCDFLLCGRWLLVCGLSCLHYLFSFSLPPLTYGKPKETPDPVPYPCLRGTFFLLVSCCVVLCCVVLCCVVLCCVYLSCLVLSCLVLTCLACLLLHFCKKFRNSTFLQIVPSKSSNRYH